MQRAQGVRPWISGGWVGVLPVLGVLFLGGCADLVHRVLAGTERCPPYHASAAATRLHHDLRVVDLHSDALLSNRDLRERGDRGHVDVPRLLEGRVVLQVFGLVTQVPLFLSMDCNSDRPDAITPLAILQCWPRCTHHSPFQRALYQCAKLARFARTSGGQLRLVRTRRDLEELLDARARGERVVGGLLALEGAHALEGRLANLDRLHDRGLRMLGFTHFFDTDVAGSAHGKRKGGLTPLGRQVVRRAEALGITLDLAHISPTAMQDVLAMATKPVVVSHTGVRATCDSVRNLSDDQIRAVAATGGVIGIGLFEYAVCGDRVEYTVRAMRHVADLVGVEHVALGSDFDGSTTSIDVSGLVLVTEALMADGFTPDEIRKIMGENALRVLAETLPEDDPHHGS